ncbi:hypothetical protein [Sulfitobacter sp. R18_1]|uniref:hypothetical protein n=1 Tax=Sulfitobacter sp. R18_1 TaxID=2821104 RepID=UPI001ADBEEF6|nr:hypothetical protein [Sulfitobacter sp. R18_1]MBO9428433.1 hypothetical protein [Sulfitobacter sp. R18_1]
MQKLVMFNGPPRAGKDTAGEICQGMLEDDMTAVKFTTAVKDYAHKTLGLNCPTDHYEALKDTPLSLFDGMSPREYYIETSRKLRATDIRAVSKMLIDKLPAIDTRFVVNTDVGMDYEAQDLVDYFGAENCLLIRVHRAGKSFDNDNRGWVEPPKGCTVIDIHNSTVEDFRKELMAVVDEFSYEPVSEFAV